MQTNTQKNIHAITATLRQTIIKTAFCAAMLLAIGLWTQTTPAFAHNGEAHEEGEKGHEAGHDEGHEAEHETKTTSSKTTSSNAAFAVVQTLWKDVQDNSDYLDGLVAQKKLSEVHEAAFNLRDSVRLLRNTSSSLSAKSATALVQNITQVDALANAMDESGDKNDLRATIANQRLFHLTLDRIAALFPTGVLKPIGPITLKSPVKDPVCRMTVDPATAPAKAAFGGQTYYFCSQGDAVAFRKAPAKYASLYENITFGAPKSFAITLSTVGQVHTGRPAPLTFAITEKVTNTLVRDFQLVHEKRMHLIVVSDDLSYFSHEHPQLGKDGRFRLSWTFPRAGRYFLFSDFTPGDGLNQILRTELTVGGAKPKALPKLVPDRSLTKVVDGYTITVKPSAPLVAGKSILMTYSIAQGGRPVTDMDLYLGANGHMMAINQNGRDIVHTHTVAAGGAVTRAMATPRGPRFTYEVTLPVGGLTKIWAQFRRGQQIITVPFVFDVAGATSMQAGTQMGMKAGMPATSKVNPTSTKSTPVGNQMQKGAVQKVTISLPQDYREGVSEVKAGVPVSLTFLLKRDAGCGNTVVVPAANWTKSLQVGEKATLVYTPQKSGPLSFQCGMGMYKGTLTVK